MAPCRRRVGLLVATRAGGRARCSGACVNCSVVREAHKVGIALKELQETPTGCPLPRSLEASRRDPIAETVGRSTSRQQPQAQCSDDFELLIELASGFLGIQNIKDVRQLYTAAHRLVGFLAAEHTAHV